MVSLASSIHQTKPKKRKNTEIVYGKLLSKVMSVMDTDKIVKEYQICCCNVKIFLTHLF